jgi:hypothetical protein
VLRDSHTDTLGEDGLAARGLQKDLVADERRGCHKRGQEQSLKFLTLIRGRGGGRGRRTNMDGVESTEPAIGSLSHGPDDASEGDDSSGVILLILIALCSVCSQSSQEEE